MGFCFLSPKNIAKNTDFCRQARYLCYKATGYEPGSMGLCATGHFLRVTTIK
jgi:hypothetical protein